MKKTEFFEFKNTIDRKDIPIEKCNSVGKIIWKMLRTLTRKSLAF